MTNACPCGQPAVGKTGKFCDSCRIERQQYWKGRPKSPNSGRKKGSHSRGYESILQDERRTAAVLIPTEVKCPTCKKKHNVLLALNEIEPGKLQYQYCETHKGNRYDDGDIWAPGRGVSRPHRAAI
jgi:hypothetical protein